MSQFLTSSEIVALEQHLNEVDPRLCGDPAMLVAMALKLDRDDDMQATVGQSIVAYVAFRWPDLQRDLRRSIEQGKLMGRLLRDVKQRKAVLN